MKTWNRAAVIVVVVVFALFFPSVFGDAGRADAEVVDPGCTGACQTCQPFAFGGRCVDAQGSGGCSCQWGWFMGNPLFPECYLSGYGCNGFIVS